jgi:hypothetical protein
VTLVMLGRIYRGVWWYQQQGPIRRTAGEFFLANDIYDEKKRAVFLSVIGVRVRTRGAEKEGGPRIYFAT